MTCSTKTSTASKAEDWLEHMDQIIDILEEGANADVIYIDFAKAFDKLDFKIFLRKIREMGVDGKVLRWINAFLTERCKQVTVNGIKSDPVPVISGVPLGECNWSSALSHSNLRH